MRRPRGTAAEPLQELQESRVQDGAKIEMDDDVDE